MLVISYTRFSSVKQSSGDSYRRQTQLAAQWCAENGMTLDTTLRFHDAGKSGWSGENARTGALSHLLAKVHAGEIPRGSVLLIEDLDRLTRAGLPVSVPLLLSILSAGLDIVTLQDRKRWTYKGMAEMNDFVLSVMLLARGNNESQRKSERVRAAFQANRDKQSRQIFGSAPGWLKRASKTDGWEIIPERAEVVVRVFELAAAGWGSIQIARKANLEGWTVPTRDTSQKKDGWHSRQAGHLLSSRQVMGEHTYRLRGNAETEVHWRGLSTGVTITDFYPQIVTDDLWHRAQTAIANRRSAPARRDAQYFNIWAGRMFCGTCGASMFRRTEFRTDNQSVSGIFKCSHAASGRTVCKSCAIKPVDATLLRDVCALAGNYMPGPGDEDDSALLAGAQSMLADVDAAAERMADIIAETGDALPAMGAKARDLAARRVVLTKEIAEMESRLAAGPEDLLDTVYADSVLAVLYKGGCDAAAIRAEFNGRLRQAVHAIWLFPYDCAIIEFVGAPNKRLLVSLPPKGKQPLNKPLTLGERFQQFITHGTSNLPAPRYGTKADTPSPNKN